MPPNLDLLRLCDTCLSAVNGPHNGNHHFTLSLSSPFITDVVELPDDFMRSRYACARRVPRGREHVGADRDGRSATQYEEKPT
ncbi:hypothetical protein PoB_000441600 [Plakobranchus ocellatus]|uniref:Uncharacterized protein n=1 Tax=Plakobranchus ocellatus TaxID=259542 RepID=A0AAV3Y3X4_9GAST|nr:hypothetical protein PoB_000441600 [Plakobranchus ocellatus]